MCKYEKPTPMRGGVRGEETLALSDQGQEAEEGQE